MWSVPRFVIPLCLASLAASRTGFCAVLSMPVEVTGAGASIPVAVSFTSQGESVSGLQFDLVFDSSALSLTAVIGSAARSSGKTLYFAAKSSQQSRFLIAEFNLNLIADGAIVTLFVNVSPQAAAGVYPIRFASVLASDTSGHAVDITASDGSITVQPIYGTAVSPEGVLNGASLLPGPVAPGEIVAIMGSAIGLPTPSGATNITFDSLPAPLLYVGSDQINAVVPFGVAGRGTTTLQIASPRGSGTPITIPVVSSAPAIFTLSGDGTGRGAVLNQDGTVNSPDNPAQSGSIIIAFATGAGQTTPPGADGLIPAAILPKPLLPVSVSIGGATAEILYAGAAPGLISGVLQVNCRLPGAAAGRAVPMLLTVGKAVSPPVTIAVK